MAWALSPRITEAAGSVGKQVGISWRATTQCRDSTRAASPRQELKSGLTVLPWANRQLQGRRRLLRGPTSSPGGNRKIADEIDCARRRRGRRASVGTIIPIRQRSSIGLAIQMSMSSRKLATPRRGAGGTPQRCSRQGRIAPVAVAMRRSTSPRLSAWSVAPSSARYEPAVQLAHAGAAPFMQRAAAIGRGRLR